jgi:tetratricopeptide (TPR) repeat protein
MVRLFVFLFFAVGVAASAQQAGGGNSAPGQSNSSQTNSAPTTPSQPPQNAPKSPNQPLQPSTPDELRFPEDDPAPPPSSPAPAAKPSAPNLAPPRSDEIQVQDLGPAVGESSSKDAPPPDLDAPPDDAKTHPQSSEAVAKAEADALGKGGVTELHSWDPHKAAKDVEVGDFYFKRGSYRAAEARYRDALLYKDNDAIATIRLAICLEKLGILDDARAEYESYLKILPHGPQAGEAEKGIARLKAETEAK